MKNLLDIESLTVEDINYILERAAFYKKKLQGNEPCSDVFVWQNYIKYVF